MDFLASHRAHVGEDAERLIAVMDEVFGVVRKPLAERLRKHRAFLAEHVLARPLDAIAVYGLSAADCTSALTSSAGAVRDDAMMAVDDLAVALDAGDAAAVGNFVRGLMASMRRGVELCEAARTGARRELVDGHAVLAADTAFQLYRYFMEMVERVLTGFAPTSMLALRGKR